MNPYQFPVTCDVCGEGGLGDIRCAGSAWLASSFIRHQDPRICADNIAFRKSQEKAKAKQEVIDVV